MLPMTKTLCGMLFLLLGLAPLAQAASQAAIQPDVRALDRMQVYAAEALADIEQARAALHDGSAPGVASQLDGARTMLDLIRSRMPAAEFHAMLRAVRAVMNFEDNKQVLPLFPKLLYSLADLPRVPAVSKARSQLQQAENDLRKPDRAGALQALDQANSEFADPILTPPLDAARHDLSVAIDALTGSGKLTGAQLRKLATDLINLHKALATYPLDMSGNVPVTPN